MLDTVGLTFIGNMSVLKGTLFSIWKGSPFIFWFHQTVFSSPLLFIAKRPFFVKSGRSVFILLFGEVAIKKTDSSEWPAESSNTDRLCQDPARFIWCVHFPKSFKRFYLFFRRICHFQFWAMSVSAHSIKSMNMSAFMPYTSMKIWLA